MKFQFSATLISLFIFSTFISCENSKNKITPQNNVEEETKNPFPNDKWTTVRSNFENFEPKAYIKALEEVKKFNQQNKSFAKKTSVASLDENWVKEGPGNIGGRFNTLKIQNNNSNIIYAGAANGGIFKTINGGNDWFPIFDDHAYLAISSIEIDPMDTNIIYVGTGDRNFGGGSHIGNGIYKSTDAGITWSNIGLETPSIVSKIIVDPSNSSTIYAATLGNVHEKNNDRGLYKSNNAGLTWENILFVSDSSGVIDLVMDTTNTNILYASVMNRTRSQFTSEVTGPDVGIYKTSDAGLTWSKLTNGLPTSEMCRIGLAISNENPNVVYASFTDESLDIFDIYKTVDAGLNWTPMLAHSAGLPINIQGNFGWYFGEVYINPYNNQQLIVPGVDMYTTTDLGLNWYANVPPWYYYEVHADKHAIAFIDSNSYIIATDGGLYKTTDNGLNWEDIENIPVTQFYHVDANPLYPGIYGGGAQDNGTLEGNASNFNFWQRIYGGDGFRLTYLEEEVDAKYVETQNGGLVHLDEFDNPTYISPITDDDFYVDWDMPYFINENTQELFIAGNKVQYMNSAPYGTYETISGDLTKVATGSYVGDKKQHVILELAQPESNSNILFAGTSDGLVWRGEKASNTWQWTNITGDLPNKMVTALRVSPNDPQTIYVGYSGYQDNDTEAYLYESVDNGTTWQDISGNLPNIIVNDILITEGTGNDSLFAALDGGVYFTANGGSTWALVGTNLPLLTMSELDIDYENERLIVGTYSRSIYSYDISWLLENISTPPPVSVDETKILNKIGPNPTSGILNFPENLFKEIKIYNIHGQFVLKESIEEYQTTIDLGNLSSGTYFLKSGTITKKIVKK